MTTPSPIALPEIQAELISEALHSAGVGLLVWDESRRYIAANPAACDILGTTLDELVGQGARRHEVEGDAAVEEALASGFASGRAIVQRLDGRGTTEVFYATFATKTAGMPFMATLLAPLHS